MPAPPRIHVALLRGINVGGKNKLPMTALTELLESAGCADVRTYIQSGNALFSASSATAKALPSALHAAIGERFGCDVPVVVRSAKELEAIVAENPFARAGVDAGELHVGFLAAKPRASAVAALDPERSPPDRFVVRGREIYLHLPNGVARTKLTNAWFDRALGTTSTMRNWKTTRKLLELALERR